MITSKMLNKLASGAVMMRVSDPRTVSASTLRAAADTIDDLLTVVLQYRDDLLYGVSGENKARRLDRINAILKEASK